MFAQGYIIFHNDLLYASSYHTRVKEQDLGYCPTFALSKPHEDKLSLQFENLPVTSNVYVLKLKQINGMTLLTVQVRHPPMLLSFIERYIF